MLQPNADNPAMGTCADWLDRSLPERLAKLRELNLRDQRAYVEDGRNQKSSPPPPPPQQQQQQQQHDGVVVEEATNAGSSEPPSQPSTTGQPSSRPGCVGLVADQPVATVAPIALDSSSGDASNDLQGEDIPAGSRYAWREQVQVSFGADTDISNTPPDRDALLATTVTRLSECLRKVLMETHRSSGFDVGRAASKAWAGVLRVLDESERHRLGLESILQKRMQTERLGREERAKLERVQKENARLRCVGSATTSLDLSPCSRPTLSHLLIVLQMADRGAAKQAGPGWRGTLRPCTWVPE